MKKALLISFSIFLSQGLFAQSAEKLDTRAIRALYEGYYKGDAKRIEKHYTPSWQNVLWRLIQRGFHAE